MKKFSNPCLQNNVKKTFLLLLTASILASSCSNKRDKVVAQVYYHKLYQSEIAKAMPKGLSPNDSLALVNDFIDDWIREQLLLHEAEKKLSVKEKNFDKQLEEYRNNLLVNTYYEKLISDTSNFKITENDLKTFMKSFDKRYTVDKEIVRVNYVKLSKGSKLIEPVKSILFNDQKRVSDKEVLAKMLGDSIEYMIDDEAWLYLDDIQNELSFDIPEDVTSNHKRVEKEIGESHYLLVVLDYKNQRSVNETEDELAAAKMMLLNQRKQQFIEKHVEELFKKAQKEGVIIR